MWRAIRFCGFAVSFLAGLTSSRFTPEGPFSKNDTLVYSIIVFLFCIGWVIFVCGVESFFDGFRTAKRQWCKPSLTIHPFTPHKPLQFWYFMALAFMSAGLGELARIAFISQGTWQGISLFWAAGIGLFIGCRCSLLFFASRFLDQEELFRNEIGRTGSSS